MKKIMLILTLAVIVAAMSAVTIIRIPVPPGAKFCPASLYPCNF